MYLYGYAYAFVATAPPPPHEQHMCYTHILFKLWVICTVHHANDQIHVYLLAVYRFKSARMVSCWDLHCKKCGVIYDTVKCIPHLFWCDCHFHDVKYSSIYFTNGVVWTLHLLQCICLFLGCDLPIQLLLKLLSSLYSDRLVDHFLHVLFFSTCNLPIQLFLCINIIVNKHLTTGIIKY